MPLLLVQRLTRSAIIILRLLLLARLLTTIITIRSIIIRLYLRLLQAQIRHRPRINSLNISLLIIRGLLLLLLILLLILRLIVTLTLRLPDDIGITIVENSRGVNEQLKSTSRFGLVDELHDLLESSYCHIDAVDLDESIARTQT